MYIQLELPLSIYTYQILNMNIHNRTFLWLHFQKVSLYATDAIFKALVKLFH